MNLLTQTKKNIKPLDKKAIHDVQKKLTDTMTNVEGLGYLKSILLNYAGISGEKIPREPKKCTIISCADHGVAEMKVSAYPPETTVHMTKNYLISKGAVANALANFSKSHMVVVDMGIAAPMDKIPGLLDRKIALGTKNCAKEAAMSRLEAIQALHTGIELVQEYTAQGYHCFLPGEMGIANTTSSAAIVACLCNLSPEEATGRGTNISDERLKVKIDVVRQTLAVNQPNPADGIDVLMKLGGFELGCIAGIILGAAANRALVVLDGFNTGAAALIAATICPTVKEYLMGSHLAAEPAHQAILEKLNLQPYMDMHFRLGEATGSSIIVNLLDGMLRAYTSLTKDHIPDLLCWQAEKVCFPITTQKLQEYNDTIRPLHQASMEKCQLRMDNLCKPIYSLGRLEEIAVKIAGITASAKPNVLPKKILCIGSKKSMSTTQQKLTAAFAEHAKAPVTLIELPKESQDLLASISGGMILAEKEIQQGTKIIGIATTENERHDICGTKVKQALQKLLTTNYIELSTFKERLLAPPTADFETPSTSDIELAYMIGLILGVAHGGSLIVLDNFISEIAAKIAIDLAPNVKDYILRTESPPDAALEWDIPSYLNLNMTTGGGCIAALGMKLIDASLHMLNDMKTFTEASVAVANDGPGAGRQKI